MKNDRQTAVLQIIEETAVETQEQLMQLLAVRGFTCTQATVSRDIKQLHLMKAPDGKGGYRYAVSAQMPKLNFEEKLQTIFRECVVSAENAQNLAIIKTMNGAEKSFFVIFFPFLLSVSHPTQNLPARLPAHPRTAAYA